jgi:3-oxo-5-alpha-steroid 4-dehydrogenase 3 / polyprenol reductase
MSPASPTTTFIAMSLLTLQCVRRFYETHFVQVFSSSSKMNFSQYLVGYIHYFGALTVVVSKAENFTASGIYFSTWITEDLISN